MTEFHFYNLIDYEYDLKKLPYSKKNHGICHLYIRNLELIYLFWRNHWKTFSIAGGLFVWREFRALARTSLASDRFNFSRQREFGSLLERPGIPPEGEIDLRKIKMPLLSVEQNLI